MAMNMRKMTVLQTVENRIILGTQKKGMTMPGKRLLQIRLHREMSQAQIARALGVSVGTIQNYEHGRAHVTAERIAQLARALQCEPHDLLVPPDSPLPRYRRPRFRPFQERASSQWYAVSCPWEHWVSVADDD
jgi:transcriptional regulator with XRE-family HTH domain